MTIRMEMSVISACTSCLLSHAELEIFFEKSNYKIEEGTQRTLGSCTNISFQFRNNQSPFTLTLSSVSIDTAEKMGLGVFINTQAITPISRATPGN